MSEPTRRPWHVKYCSGAYAAIDSAEAMVRVAVLECDASDVEAKRSLEADAALIVRAVNAHEALRDALADVERWLLSGTGDFSPEKLGFTGKFRERVRAALKLAGVDHG